MKCSKCGAEVAENAKFCCECGTKVERELFCPECGKALTQANANNSVETMQQNQAGSPSNIEPFVSTPSSGGRRPRSAAPS